MRSVDSGADGGGSVVRARSTTGRWSALGLAGAGLVAKLFCTLSRWGVKSCQADVVGRSTASVKKRVCTQTRAETELS
jgi:hypothetical protein